MEGIVLEYETGAGIVTTSTGARYRFQRSEWKTAREPAVGDRVRFLVDDDRATAIYGIPSAAASASGSINALVRSEVAVPALIYACYATAFLYGLTMLFGVVVAYTYRESAAGKWYHSHYDYQIAMFWKSLGFFLIAIPLTFFYSLGMVIVLCTYIWVILKIGKGWRCLADRRAVS